tara:strand:- start:104 stop:361 length:258 start_codon:yes stop_codon:yes gene_type:complete
MVPLDVVGVDNLDTMQQAAKKNANKWKSGLTARINEIDTVPPDTFQRERVKPPAPKTAVVLTAASPNTQSAPAKLESQTSPFTRR